MKARFHGCCRQFLPEFLRRIHVREKRGDPAILKTLIRLISDINDIVVVVGTVGAIDSTRTNGRHRSRLKNGGGERKETL